MPRDLWDVVTRYIHNAGLAEMARLAAAHRKVKRSIVLFLSALLISKGWLKV